ncbi:hypothetical protein PoB_003983700 [Plakobranchus ocellatus]|uniref:Uncharacterized protein n=1 Tax=Plakobranchus ocellatus TaxID=259542 RepID=A0AAV4B286_9GAST|nr:hypothetical protein PoB_003983700 [Plakobranchus ocellatus]
MCTSTPFGKKIGMLKGQTSSTKYSPTWEKTSAKEVKEQVENGRRTAVEPEKRPDSGFDNVSERKGHVFVLSADKYKREENEGERREKERERGGER